MKFRQFELIEIATGARLITWLEDEPRLKVGAKLTLKPTRNILWVINARYTTTESRETLDARRQWKVGGLK